MPHIAAASWILHTDSNRTYAILSAPRWNISVPDGPEKDFMNSLQMWYHCSVVLEETVNNHFLRSLSKTAWFWVPMPSTTSSFASYYVWPCNIRVTVTPCRSQKFYPLLCSKAQTNPQRSSLWHFWAFDEIKARSKVVTQMLPALSCYTPDICICRDKHTAQSTSGVTPNRDHQTWEKTCSSRECGKMMFSTAQVKINHLRTNPWD